MDKLNEALWAARIAYAHAVLDVLGEAFNQTDETRSAFEDNLKAELNEFDRVIENVSMERTKNRPHHAEQPFMTMFERFERHDFSFEYPGFWQRPLAGKWSLTVGIEDSGFVLQLQDSEGRCEGLREIARDDIEQVWACFYDTQRALKAVL